MRRTILLTSGWVATAALAVTMTALVLTDAEGGASGGALTESDVTKKLAAEDTTAVPSSTDNPSGAAATAAQGTPIVTKGGTLSVRCKPNQPHVIEHVTRVTKPGWRIENLSDGLANSVAVAHGMPNRLLTVISNGSLAAVAIMGDKRLLLREKLRAHPEAVWIAGGKGETIAVLSWCENGRPKWVLNDR
jgi:hypothetical protein